MVWSQASLDEIFVAAIICLLSDQRTSKIRQSLSKMEPSN